ncbi:MAG TPA: hypothetical protein VHI52_14065, partial [Verrucomicrobiae bacterium]|nr:hypothetical protein [Verrucomicrobiae bacterium]
RELGQNSLDARQDPKKPVVLEFELLEMSRESIPDIDYLQDTFVRCARFWSHAKKSVEFFKNAEKLAKAKQITVLRVGDYNTTGVRGSDKDKEKNWYNLQRQFTKHLFISAYLGRVLLHPDNLPFGSQVGLV